jgi:hypothetical protein
VVLDECTIKQQMPTLDRAVELSQLELRKVRRIDRDSGVIRRDDLESVAMIADPHSADSCAAVQRSLSVGVQTPATPATGPPLSDLRARAFSDPDPTPTSGIFRLANRPGCGRVVGTNRQIA